MGKSVKVTPPEGYEIDKENSTLEEIKFKKIESKLPTKWEDFEKISGYYVNSGSEVTKLSESTNLSVDVNKNIWPTKELAEASLALCQLVRYRDAWNEGWKPDWNLSTQYKYCIFVSRGRVTSAFFWIDDTILSFKTAELRDRFLETFKDLLEIAKPLL